MPKSVFWDIYRDIKANIEDGTYAYQSFLPSEAELTASFACSRSSVRRALAQLAADGYVQSQQGKGVRVIRDRRWRRRTATTDSRRFARWRCAVGSSRAPRRYSLSR